jgi:hypothetical protein
MFFCVIEIVAACMLFFYAWLFDAHEFKYWIMLKLFPVALAVFLLIDAAVTSNIISFNGF